MNTPDWLTRRGGSLKLGSDGQTWFVYFAERPDYRVNAAPVDGEFGSVVRQTINGKRIETQGTFATADEAIQSGLDGLRKALGWD